MTGLRTISTDRAPPPGGHYSQATVAGGLVFVSGQLPIGWDGSGGFAEQARLALSHLLAILGEAGCPNDRIAKVTAYIVGVENWPTFNTVYADLLGPARPARAVVPVPELHHGYLVEVDAVGIAG